MKKLLSAFAVLSFALPLSTAEDKGNANVLFSSKLVSDKDAKGLSGSSATYSKNRNGFLQRSGSLRTSPGGRVSTYRKNKYGFEEKVGSIK